MSWQQTGRIAFFGFAIAGIVVVIALTGWALWPSFRTYSISQAAIDERGPAAWWPQNWQDELKAIQTVVTVIKEERGVGPDKNHCRVEPHRVEQPTAELKKQHSVDAAVQVFIAILQDEKRTTASRMLAVLALGEIGPKSVDAVPALIHVLEASAEDVPGWHDLSVAEREESTVSQATMLRYFSVYALRTIGPGAGRAVPVLTAAASDPRSLVGESAARAVKRIESEIAKQDRKD